MYAQDFDETFPAIVFAADAAGNDIYVWRNAVQPYVKNKGVFSCPSNPRGRPSGPGGPGATAHNGNGEGWHSEPDRIMPTSYAMNSCATSWLPHNVSWAKQRAGADATPPLQDAQISRPSETIAIGELTEIWSDINVNWVFSGKGPGGSCAWAFMHFGAWPNGNPSAPANWIFWDGHVQSKKWAQTIYPLNKNNWERDPNPDPNNTRISGEVACRFPIPPTITCENFR
jgi:hypothetical protein